MRRKIIIFGKYFNEFINKLTNKEREKVDYGLVLLKTQDRLPVKFVKHIRDGLYELRTEYQGNRYRVFFIFDTGTIVVLFNGFQKQTQKTPVKEIEKALRIKEEYYEYKREHDTGL
jgi:phage-related protein